MAFQVGKQKIEKPKEIKKPVKKAAPAAPKPKAPPPDQALEFGLWWVEHKYTVRYLAILTGLAIGGFLLLYGIYGLVDYYLISYSANQRLFQPRTVGLNWGYISQVSTPEDLSIGKTQAIRSGDKYDLLVQISNPNDKWYASSLTYHFDFGGVSTETKTTYVLPGESMYLAELNVERATAATATLVVEDIELKKYPGFASLKEQLLNFEITDTAYIPSRQTQIVGEERINQVKFTIENKSPQNYWNVDLIILLYAGTQVRAVNIYNLDSLDSLEQREVTINWPGALPAINKVSVVPQINILDPESFKGFGEVIGEEK